MGSSARPRSTPGGTRHTTVRTPSSGTRPPSTSAPLRAASVALTLLATAPTLAAQRYWRGNFYPFAYYSVTDGFWGAAHYGRFSPLGFAPRPEPNHASISVDASASTRGSYAVIADAWAPAWWDGWRARLTLTATRDNRLGYYGIGNDTRYNPDSGSAVGPYVYRVSRTRVMARADLQRRLLGPLRVLAGVGLARTDFRPLPGPSVFRADLSAGTIDPGTLPFTDKVARAGLIVDTRDNEVDPHTGVFIEALFAAGTHYTRTTGHARVHVRPVRPLVLAGRLGAEGTGGTPPLAVIQEMESSERPFVAVGGYRSLRGYQESRFVGRGKLIGSLEARYEVMAVGDAFQVKLVAFYDAGRVFDSGEAVRLTNADLHESGGVEVAVRVLRNALVVGGYGHGSDGGKALFGAGWSY